MSRPRMNWAVVIALAFAGGCTTGQWADRKRDAADCVTLSVGRGYVGAKANVGPVGAGLPVLASPGLLPVVKRNPKTLPFGGNEEWGLRGGVVDAYSTEDLWALFWASEYYGEGPIRGRNKDFSYPFGVPLLTPEYWQAKHACQFTQLEVAGGLYGYVRCGVNPGEFLDFLLGWVGVDIYGDDLGRGLPGAAKPAGPDR